MNRYCKKNIYKYVYIRRINIVKVVEKFINRSANPFDTPLRCVTGESR